MSLYDVIDYDIAEVDPAPVLCTCCYPGRPMIQPEPKGEWAHADDDTYAEVFHVHSDGESTDCDGRYSRSSVLRINTFNERAGVEDKSDLWRHAIESAMTTHGRCTVQIDGEEHTAEINENHDEGYRATSLRGCTDPGCAYDDSEFRDHRAEAAGY